MRRGTDGGVDSGALRQLGDILRRRPEMRPWTCDAEVGWRRRWACVGNGRRSDGRDSTRVLSGEWGMGGDPAKGVGQVRSASQTRAPDRRVVAPWSV